MTGMYAARGLAAPTCFADAFSYQYCCLGVGHLATVGNPNCWQGAYNYEQCCVWRGAGFKYEETLYRSDLSELHVRANSSSGRRGVSRRPTGPVHIVFYHKTGTVLSGLIAEVLTGQVGRQTVPAYVWQTHLQGVKFGFGWPVLHFVRDPLHWIVSAYKYHIQKPALENWLHNKNLCSGEFGSRGPSILSMTYPEDCSWIFDGCSNLCNYWDVLQHANVGVRRKLLTGLVVEYRHMRREVDEMLRRLKDWLNKPWVLHLSVEHFAQAFDGTTRCVARFLRFAPEQTAAFVEAMLPISRPQHEEHVTRGRAGGKAEQMRMLLLLASTFWEAQFRRIRAALQAVDRRQAEAYGCPAVAYQELRGPRGAVMRRAWHAVANASGPRTKGGLRPSCWAQGYTPAVCCSRRWGPRGLEACWDDDSDGLFTYERCCGGPSAVAGLAALAAS